MKKVIRFLAKLKLNAYLVNTSEEFRFLYYLFSSKSSFIL